MHKDELKDLIDYIVNDKNIESNIEKFNNANTYFFNISRHLNVFGFTLFMGVITFLLCGYFDFRNVGVFFSTILISLFSFIFSAICSDNNVFKYPYLYYLFPNIKRKYVKKQKLKLKELYFNNNSFYKVMNEIKKNTKNNSLFKYFERARLRTREEILKLILNRLKETKSESENISDLSSIIIELNINKSKNNAAKYLFSYLNSLIKSFEEDASFKKSIILYSDSESDDKSNAIQ